VTHHPFKKNAKNENENTMPNQNEKYQNKKNRSPLVRTTAWVSPQTLLHCWPNSTRKLKFSLKIRFNALKLDYNALKLFFGLKTKT
jgi:hypothetical protein